MNTNPFTNNSYLISYLNENMSFLGSMHHEPLNFIIEKIKSQNTSILSFSDLEEKLVDINFGTPENPNNIKISKLPIELRDFLDEQIKNQAKQRFIKIHLETINQSKLPYTSKEKKYIESFVKKINIQKISLEKTGGLFSFLDSVIDPFIDAVRKKCSNSEAEMSQQLSFKDCDDRLRRELLELYNEIENSNDFNKGFFARPQNSLDIKVSKPTFNDIVKSQNLDSAKEFIDNQSEKSIESFQTSTETINDFLNNNVPTQAYDQNDTVDVRALGNLGSSDPNFSDCVDPDAPYLSSNFKTRTKQNHLLVLDVYPDDLNTAVFPLAINNMNIDLGENLIISREADMQLEFINLHGIQGNSTIANRLSIENYHGLVLNITELTKYFNTFSNRSDLKNRFYIPNDTYGYQDQEDISDKIIVSGVISGFNDNGLDNDTITLPANAGYSTVNDFYNDFYLEFTSGNAQVEVLKIKDYGYDDETGIGTITVDGSYAATPAISDTFDIIDRSKDKTLNSATIKLKNSYMCTINPEKLNKFTISLQGLKNGVNSAEQLYLSSSNSRLQIGLYIKER